MARHAKARFESLSTGGIALQKSKTCVWAQSWASVGARGGGGQSPNPTSLCRAAPRVHPDLDDMLWLPVASVLCVLFRASLPCQPRLAGCTPTGAMGMCPTPLTYIVQSQQSRTRNDDQERQHGDE